MSLTGTLDATKSGDAVTFSFTVTNDGDALVELQFSDSQTHDVAVVEDDDTEVWRWSDGRMFMQMLQQESIDAGDSVTFECSWDDPQPGSYVAEAFLSASNADCDASCSFSV
ncbi:BsuPI-related putative proteinase inhibitor [Haloarchaeobius sp. TZWWS8]|uniref:BsuPI-related putative proteinase inhibitor n=1 Tax=Haloarchaeobius sp. TZWWS8 TaxID=3446121 RepID=UPI003EB81401